MEKTSKKENVRVKIYAKGCIATCTLENVEAELKNTCITEDGLYGIQILFSAEENTDNITNPDVFKMNHEQFQNFVDNIYLQQDIITILVGYKLSGNKEAVNKRINYDDIVWLHYVDDYFVSSAYDEIRDLGWEFIINNK